MLENFNFFKNRKIITIIVIVFLVTGGIGFYFAHQRTEIKNSAPKKVIYSRQDNFSDKSDIIQTTSSLCKTSIKDASNHIGENCQVSGKVDHIYISKKGTVFFDFCPDYKNCPFSAVIFQSQANQFDPFKYEQKVVQITGLIKTYQGRPEIIINEPSQIKIK